MKRTTKLVACSALAVAIIGSWCVVLARGLDKKRAVHTVQGMKFEGDCTLGNIGGSFFENDVWKYSGKPCVISTGPEDALAESKEEKPVQTQQDVIAEIENHKHELAWKLQTCVLSEADMREVQEQRSFLFTPGQMIPYFQEDVDRQFSNALGLQNQLRTMHAEPCKY